MARRVLWPIAFWTSSHRYLTFQFYYRLVRLAMVCSALAQQDKCGAASSLPARRCQGVNRAVLRRCPSRCHSHTTLRCQGRILWEGNHSRNLKSPLQFPITEKYSCELCTFLSFPLITILRQPIFRGESSRHPLQTSLSIHLSRHIFSFMTNLKAPFGILLPLATIPLPGDS